jgi:hypothetical protein
MRIAFEHFFLITIMEVEVIKGGRFIQFMRYDRCA